MTLVWTARCLCLVAGALPICLANAGQPSRPPDQASVFLMWQPLSAEILDRQRGGFVDISGITVSVGLERMVLINGQLVQSLTLTIPDLTSLPSKGSAGGVSVQGPGAITVPAVEVHVPQIAVNVGSPSSTSAPAQPASQQQQTSALSSPQPVGTISPGSASGALPPTSTAVTGGVAPASSPPPGGAAQVANAPLPSAVSPVSGQTGAGGSGNVAQQPGAATPAPAPAANPSAVQQQLAGSSQPGSVRVASPQPGGVIAASVIQNGPGNVVTPDVMRNLGPSVLTVVQNTLNNQRIQGMTVMNIDVSGIRNLIRNDVLSTLNITLRGFGR
jgi:hypothetical protein